MWLRRFRKIFTVVVLAVAPMAARAEIKVGDAFPDLAASGLSVLGGGEKLPDLRDKVVLVDFWASWCAPCKASFPAMGKLHADFASRGLTIVAVSVDENRPAAAGFWKKMAAPFFGAHDSSKKMVGEVAVPAMPTSYLMGRDGRVRFIHQGFHGDATEREVRKEIEALLAEKAPSL
jgi:thiol-disulfide isomerase/thioredoxin